MEDLAGYAWFALVGAGIAEQTEQVREGLGFLRTALLVFAFVALFVGAFVIFNTFNIVVTQRTRELGLLRAVGATRGQILRSVLAVVLRRPVTWKGRRLEV